MDKRLKKGGVRDNCPENLNQFIKDTQAGSLSIAESVKTMQRISKLTQAEFAKYRGISLSTLKDIQSGRGNSTIKTLNEIGEIFGLEVKYGSKKDDK